MIITFAQQKGGAGKTTLAVHLGHAWHLDGKSVAVADLDPQRSLAMWSAQPKAPPITVLESAGWRAGSDIRDLAKAHDITLVDCPGNASNLLEAALRESDLVVVPCGASMLDVWATAPVLEMAAKEKVPAVVVLNRVPPRGGATEDVKAALAEQGAMVAEATLGNRVGYAHGLATGTTAFGVASAARARGEITALKAELAKKAKR